MPPTTLLWLAGIQLTLSAAALALSRPFRIERLSFLGIDANLTKPIEWMGHRWLAILAAVLLLGALVTGVMGVKGMIVVPSQWPTKFEDVKTAEVQLSEVDDQIDVSVNHAHLAHAEWGQAPPWMSIKDALHPGANAIEIWITNGEYGGCGGTATLRLNGVTNPAYSWTWKEAENRPKGTTCFRSVKTLNLEP